MHRKQKKSIKRKKQLSYRGKTGILGKQAREWIQMEKKKEIITN